MSSFVAEVLSSAGQMEREEINEKLSLLVRRMEELKLDIHDATIATFNNFELSFDATITLTDRVKLISEEMKELSHKIDSEIKGQLNVSTVEFQALSEQLEQITAVMTLLDKLVNAQQLIEDIANTTKEGKFSQAASTLLQLEKALSQPLCQREEEIKIFIALRIEQKVLKQNLIQNLNDAWKAMITWTHIDSLPQVENLIHSKGDEARKKEHMHFCELKLPKGTENEQNSLSEVVAALDSLGQLDNKIQTFGHQLLKYVFYDLIFHWKKVLITETSLNEGKQLVIKAASDQTQPCFMEVFVNVGSLLDILLESFQYKVPRQEQANAGVSCENKVSLITLLGHEIGNKVLEGIVKECLSHAIPNSSKELETFHEVIAITEKFQQKLVSIGFIDASCHILLDYVQNVNVLFANKKCQDILERARCLMTSEIHDTIQVRLDSSAGELPPLDKSGGPPKEKSRKLVITEDLLLSAATFRMPTCKISLCVQELLDLVYTTLNEASSSTPQCAAQMFYAVRNIFELFCSVFPTYHAHSLANFPQLTALHHNNCMYLAHHLLTLGHQFHSTLPPDVSATFVDLIPEIRALGTTSFLDQMNMQKAIIEKYLQAAGGFAAVDEDANYTVADKAVKQALHQLSHLQKIWQDVLPSPVYLKAIGILLNSLITDMINSLTALEDISLDAACKLNLLTTLIKDKGASLFLPVTEIDNKPNNNAEADLHRHVPSWTRFNELCLILNGSLQEIADRWADGMGPLATEFTPNEVKQLIRALFQNTEKRAATLAKIK